MVGRRTGEQGQGTRKTAAGRENSGVAAVARGGLGRVAEGGVDCLPKGSRTVSIPQGGFSLAPSDLPEVVSV